MKTKSALIFALTLFCSTVFSQNYLGYSKQYIIKALRAERKDMKELAAFKSDTMNYISYVARDNKRTVIYHFTKTEAVKNGKNIWEEICTKYVSKNKCKSYSECPEMDEVVRSLDSHFTKEGNDVWVDYSKKIPHEWIIVKDENYFEVHVTEREQPVNK